MSDTATEDRKRKLQEMRAKAQKSSGTNAPAEVGTAGESADGGESSEKKIKFRNYQPYDHSLKKSTAKEEVKENKESQEMNVTGVTAREETDVIKLELQKFQDSELNIMPKKPNWDLKVQVEGKLLKLKNRTQKAIVEILREKLAEENNDEEQ